ncbi:hypothetical protein EJB05_36962, partial [Eragrostis curvula]
MSSGVDRNSALPDDVSVLAFCRKQFRHVAPWCVANGLGALFCILEHSPVLEKLTLQLAKGPNRRREMDAINNVMEKSAAISKILKMVDVQCDVVDDRVCNILKLLKTLEVKFTIRRTKKNWLNAS